LSEEYDIALFNYNPNIYPESEYQARLREVEKVAAGFALPLLSGGYDHARWLSHVRGLENEPERGARCEACLRSRLEETAKRAFADGFGFFTTTLTISPHKNADIINSIGSEMSERYGIKFLAEDFKKKDGFKSSVAMSRELGLARQNYCGCEFSVKHQPNI
jgi:predicted adenine nucleotide alpha hydrolase (AANH) superfamily ATPase